MVENIYIDKIWNDLSKKQKLAIIKLKKHSLRYVLYGGAAGGGKSWLGCCWLILCCLMYSETRWFIGRNRLKDVRFSVLVTFDKVCRKYGITCYRLKDDQIVFCNGSVIELIDLSFYPKKDPFYERFGSVEYTGGWIEEAGEIHFLAYDVLKSRIGRHLNNELNLEPKILITCNPKKNWLYKMFYKPWRSGQLDKSMAFIRALVTDNPFIDSQYIESLKSISNKAQRMRLLMGLWEYEDNQNSLVDYDALLDCFSNTIKPEGVSRISADIALKGRDRFVCTLWKGLYARVAIDVPYCTAAQAENELRALAERNSVARSQIIADSDGVGAYLSSYYKGIKEFHGGESAFDKKYFNLKNECAYKLAEFINKRRIHIECNDEQMERIKEEIDVCLIAKDVDADTSKLRIIGKDEQKQTLGHSPDFFDSLNMGMVYYIKPQPQGVRMRFGEI